VVLRWYYSGVTVVLQWCNSGVTVVLQWYRQQPHSLPHSSNDKLAQDCATPTHVTLMSEWGGGGGEGEGKGAREKGCSREWVVIKDDLVERSMRRPSRAAQPSSPGGEGSECQTKLHHEFKICRFTKNGQCLVHVFNQ
jgi:hypothetical protein